MSGANNVYDVTVQVSDGNGGTDTQTIAVTVTDVNPEGDGRTMVTIPSSPPQVTKHSLASAAATR